MLQNHQIRPIHNLPNAEPIIVEARRAPSEESADLINDIDEMLDAVSAPFNKNKECGSRQLVIGMESRNPQLLPGGRWTFVKRQESYADSI